MTEQYIFNADVSKSFYEKLDGLHNKHVDFLLLCGVAPKGTGLESVKMTKNSKFPLKHCERVVGGLININPKIIARLTEERRVRLECIFTKIDDNQCINHVYMVQNVMDWPQIGSFSCQVWCLGETTINQIKDHWNA